MGRVHNLPTPVLVAWMALLVLAGACVSQAVSTFEAMPTQLSATTAVVATSQKPVEQPTEAADPVTPESSWHQEGSGQSLEIPSCFDFDHGILSGAPDPACDINFLAGRQPGSADLYPTSGALLDATRALATAAQGDCTDSPSMSHEPVTVDLASAPGVVCFETAEGRHGLLDIVDADLQAAYIVTFDWWTFDPAVATGTSQGDSLPLAYANETYGFQLTLPASWNGFSVNELEGSGVGSVCFSFNRAMPVCVLQIDVYTHSQWNQLKKLREDYYVGENDSYVFGAGPYTEACVQMDEFQCDRYHEVPAILETFETE
jgi:hypothetical protein